jgi:hypothetical protein
MFAEAFRLGQDSNNLDEQAPNQSPALGLTKGQQCVVIGDKGLDSVDICRNMSF